MHFESIENKPESAESWYKKAKEKAEGFIHSISPTLTVKSGLRLITLDGQTEKEEKMCLLFEDTKKGLKWSMYILENQEYINTLNYEMQKMS